MGIDFKALLSKYWWAIPIVLVVAFMMFRKPKSYRRRRRMQRLRRRVSRRISRAGRKLKFGSPAWRRRYANKIRRGRNRKKRAS